MSDKSQLRTQCTTSGDAVVVGETAGTITLRVEGPGGAWEVPLSSENARRVLADMAHLLGRIEDPRRLIGQAAGVCR